MFAAHAALVQNEMGETFQHFCPVRDPLGATPDDELKVDAVRCVCVEDAYVIKHAICAPESQLAFGVSKKNRFDKSFGIEVCIHEVAVWRPEL